MAVPGIPVRCPHCATELRAFVAPMPPTQWFPCPHCRAPVAVVVPRDPPPLYSWEVLPGLYPPLDRPTAPRWRLSAAVAIALIVAAVGSAGLAGGLAYYGVAATAPASFTVSGQVEADHGGSLQGVAGARVALTNDHGATSVETTLADGRFSFSGVPSGGVAINVTAPGYAPVTVETFVSPVYDAGSSALGIVLSAATTANGSTVALSPFSDMENFLASVVGGTALLALATAIAGVAALATWRERYRTSAVVGGGAGVAAPAVILFLGLSSAFPWLAVASIAAASAGLFAIGAGATELYRAGSPPGTR
jgi:hypothetical protein